MKKLKQLREAVTALALALALLFAGSLAARRIERAAAGPAGFYVPKGDYDAVFAVLENIWPGIREKIPDKIVVQ